MVRLHNGEKVLIGTILRPEECGHHVGDLSFSSGILSFVGMIWL